MTDTTKPVRRETLSVTRERGMRPLVIQLGTTFVSIRPKGLLRAPFVVTYQQIYNLGARYAAEEIRRQRAEARKKK